MKMTPKMKLTLTATIHAAFHLDYNSHTDHRPKMMFSVETGKRNPLLINMMTF